MLTEHERCLKQIRLMRQTTKENESHATLTSYGIELWQRCWMGHRNCPMWLYILRAQFNCNCRQRTESHRFFVDWFMLSLLTVANLMFLIGYSLQSRYKLTEYFWQDRQTVKWGSLKMPRMNTETLWTCNSYASSYTTGQEKLRLT